MQVEMLVFAPLFVIINNKALSYYSPASSRPVAPPSYPAALV